MASELEKALRLLVYLKKYTSRSNPTSMPLIDYYFNKKGYPDFFGTPNSKRRNKRDLIKKMAKILNSDINGNPLPKEDWVIMYDGLGESNSDKREFICNLYYNQHFESWDLDDIINSIKQNEKLSEERKKELTGKIERYVADKNYTDPNACVKRGMDPIEKKKFLVYGSWGRRQTASYIFRKPSPYDYYDF